MIEIPFFWGIPWQSIFHALPNCDEKDWANFLKRFNEIYGIELDGIVRDAFVQGNKVPTTMEAQSLQGVRVTKRACNGMTIRGRGHVEHVGMQYVYVYVCVCTSDRQRDREFLCATFVDSISTADTDKRSRYRWRATTRGVFQRFMLYYIFVQCTVRGNNAAAVALADVVAALA